MGLYFNIALFLPFSDFENKEVIVKGYVVEKNSKNSEYIVYIQKFDRYELIKEFKVKIYCKEELEIGDRVVFKGIYTKGEKSRNYKGFNYMNYLRQNSLYGIINIEDKSNIKVIGNFRNINVFISILKSYLNSSLEEIYNGEYVGFIQSLLLGNKSNLDKEITELFKINSISHVLAISGMHIGIILITVDNILDNNLKNKRLKYYIEILFLIFFYIITGMQVSCFRSVVFNIINIIYKLRFDKNDIVKTVVVTYILLIVVNIYNIINIGLYLSFLSSISIMVFNKFFNKLFKSKNKIQSFVKESFVISISAQILILPVMVYSFNFFSLNFLINNLIISVCISGILKFGYITLNINSINVFKFELIVFLNKVIVFVIELILKFIFSIFDVISKIEFLNIKFITPSFIFVIIWYVVVVFIVYNFKNNIYFFYKFIKSEKRRKQVMIKIKDNKISINSLKFYRNKLDKNNKIFLIIIVFLIIILIINNILFYLAHNGFKIYFIDVGQGDCCLVKSNLNKTILIDSGEGESSKSDKGKNVVYPYLLDRKINKIDYIIISHFDSDHAGGMIYILENMKVENVIIGVQNEDSYLYQKVLNIVKEKNINLVVIDNVKTIYIDKIKITFLWPIKNKMVTENKLNNNSLVFKLEYKNLSILFTGDIEIPAEEKIVAEYKDKSYLLKSDILKVAHHGSDTSTTEEFLKLVLPRYCLIGVGKNNNFNHPNDIVIERLEKYNVKIYRTDLYGEIIINIKNKKLKFNCMIK